MMPTAHRLAPTRAAPMTRHGLTWWERLLGLAEIVHAQYRDPGAPGQAWRPISLWRPKWCNCLIWAASQQRRHGGYVLKRRAQLAWKWHRHGRARPAFFRHALWSPDGQTCWEYTQDKPDWVPWWRLPMYLLYPGEARLVTRQWP